MPSRGLVLVHAHPDDEAIGTGGVMAKYADEGVHVCLVTCTNGELGEVADVPELGTVEEIATRLGDVRRDELRDACRHLGSIDLRMLGYRDSGMEGTEGNADPRSFVNQDIEGPVRDVVTILREVRPQVVVTYNEFGLYGHPDHIRAHAVALDAVRRAADPSFAPELGPPHEVAKLYYTAVSRSFMRAGRELAGELGFGDGYFTEDEIEAIGTDDAFITTTIDVSAFVDRKFAALEAHRTQRGTTEMFLSIPERFRVFALGLEHYVLVQPRLSEGTRESDLFEGLVV
jgi:N-acetyl-1-D-myo-inositol-2-amino-2-deoxy-alpha-D-glucopyranoside deacetylase